ncbi:DUF2306 domain-containing protein [Paenibacillus medicaginis]|uniref:DUF2306 domain-containing protein n=1 Tax=Paenibacillus medicaginis TaxID=1470560 RepID=A0ABV5C8H1_9BACL
MRSRKALIITLSVIAVMWIFHTASKNFIVDPTFSKFLSKKDIKLPNIDLWVIMIRLHIVLAIVALITGPLGLSKRIRTKRPSLHRWNGRIYVVSVILNVIPGYYVSFYANGGFWSVIGFLILNTLWLLTTVNGYRFIRKGQVRQHRIWVLRSFFLTYANLTIYIIVTIFHKGVGLQYGSSYTLAVWLAFTINLLLAELVIRKSSI